MKELPQSSAPVLSSHCHATTIHDFLSSLEDLRKPALLSIADSHNISLPLPTSINVLRDLISDHVSSGKCISSSSSFCIDFNLNFPVTVEDSGGQDDLSLIHSKITILNQIAPKLSQRALRRILSYNSVAYHPNDSRSQLRRELKKFITRLKHGKRTEEQRNAAIVAEKSLHAQYQDLLDSWPKIVRQDLKDKIIKLFNEQTSKDTLSTFTCASCGEETLCSSHKELLVSDIELDNLRLPDSYASKNLPYPYNEGPLQNVAVDPSGVHSNEQGKLILSLCKDCHSSLKRCKVPALAMANLNYLGPVPDELKDLTVVEEAMIARCRAKCWIVQLNEDREITMPDSQRGVKGHIIIYPQRPSQVSCLLPPSITEILTPLCVLFIGSSPPTPEWLREKAKPLCVRREKVRSALVWLKKNNPLYCDIDINHTVLDSLEDEQVLPFHVEHVLPSDASQTLTSRYDGLDSENTGNLDNNSVPATVHTATSDLSNLSNDAHMQPSEYINDSDAGSIELESIDLPFQNVVITDVEGHAPANELRSAALRHVKKGGGYIQIPHDPTPVNEFFNPNLFPMIYPTLFPYGVGGFENKNRKKALSMKRHVKHLFSLSDRRFQEHYSFLFTVFNILQRRTVLLHTSLKTRKASFPIIAKDFASVSPETIHIVTERISRGDSVTANNSEERKVLNLMKQVTAVTSNVPGTSASRVAMRNEIRGLMIEKGMPSFFITINPADIYNPLVKFLGGADIDIDNLLPEQVPKYMEQSILVAKNPFVAAKFFNIYMKSFISALLGFDPMYKNLDGGILGVVKAYYGCVEAQGRGTLHCHMMVWLEGALNPNEIRKKIITEGNTEFRDRLIAYLDDTISNEIPNDPVSNIQVPSSRYHPCSVRGLSSGTDHNDARAKDMYNLSKSCQAHKHSKTCYKYWKGPPHPRECRFDLDSSNTRSDTTFDIETGELSMRCLDGLVNNFNATILEAMRCNMDIKFIGSGAAAKSIIYYITNYITKSQLKTHVAHAALELSVKKLGEYNPEDDEITLRAKKLLQKCAYAMISHQELSAQQVASYLMDYEDHFTSHEYRNLFWTSFEAFINRESASPECYQHGLSVTSESTTQLELESNLPLEANDSDLDITINNTNSELFSESIVDDSGDDLGSDDEINIATHPSGKLIAKANQVSDYQLRDHQLKDLCVWDFVSHVQKIRKPRKLNEQQEYLINNNFNNNDCDLEPDDHDSETEIEPDLDCDKLQRGRAKKCYYTLQDSHIEANTHCLTLKPERDKFVPVPIGPSIPRNDRKEVFPRYCRLMLILFKPWRHADDLRLLGQSWEDAFKDFVATCPIRIKKLLDNIQLLHECKDSAQDHFIQRRNSNRVRRQLSDEIVNSSRHDTNDDFGPVNPEIILDHLQSISDCNSQRIARSQEAVKDCLLNAELNGMFDVSDESTHCQPEAVSNNLFGRDLHSPEEVNSSDMFLEDQWRSEYNTRRENWKRNATKNNENINIINPSSSQQSNLQNIGIVNDGAAFRNAIEKQMPLQATIAQDIPETIQENTVDIDEIINEFTLNTEQARAFRIICEHSLEKGKEPLRMYLGGAGGTGKSRVIHALKEFFIRRNQMRRFRLASYTGVAARNISGMTVHAALCLNQRIKSSAQSKTRRDLTAMWEGVDYFFIDEVSMIGCAMLHKISQALIDAKGINSPFGHVNMIVAGDFGQLPPVGETRLYAHVDTTKTRSSSPRGQETIFGRLLWLSFKKVVILSESMRQSGPKNARLVELLADFVKEDVLMMTSIFYQVASLEMYQ